MVRIGIVGVGFMGMIHFLAARGLQGARVTAICSRDPKKLAGDWRDIQGNFGPAGEVIYWYFREVPKLTLTVGVADAEKQAAAAALQGAT